MLLRYISRTYKQLDAVYRVKIFNLLSQPQRKMDS